MTSFAELKEKAIILETEINRKIQEIQKTNFPAAKAAEHASNILAHQVVEWLETARKREQQTR